MQNVSCPVSSGLLCGEHKPRQDFPDDFAPTSPASPLRRDLRARGDARHDRRRRMEPAGDPRALGKLAHPNVVAIHDADETDGEHFDHLYRMVDGVGPFKDVRKLRDQAVKEAGIDLVVGHHAHVAAGVQEIEGRLVFYGLGNFLHLGMQDMQSFGLCRDYGLLARLHLGRGKDGRYSARAIEALPLAGMHARTERMPAQQATARIHVLNHLAGRLDDAAARARGVRFTPQPDGTGLYCAAGAAEDGGRIGALCREWREPAAPSDALARQIAASCGSTYVSAARRQQVGAQAKAKSTNPFSGIFGF